MDGERFDGIARGLTSARSRRGLLAGLAALLTGAGLGRDDAAAQDGRGRKKRQRACLKNGTRCSANSGGPGDNCDRCCSRSTVRRPDGGRRCACRPVNATCQANRQCCSRQCVANVCLACPAGETDCPSTGCANLQTDDANCGTCGEACTANETCAQGSCEPLPCGAGGTCAVFVTNGAYRGGSLGGLVGADALCQAAANASGSLASTGTYKAWLSDATTSAAARLYQSPEPYVLVDGTQVAADWAALIDPASNLLNPINLSETGVAVTFAVWTNTNDNGTQTRTQPENICRNWATQQGGFFLGTFGTTTNVDARWTAVDDVAGCNTDLRLYCFQQA